MVFAAFPACPRCTWTDLGPKILRFRCLPGLPPVLMASPWLSDVWFWGLWAGLWPASGPPLFDFLGRWAGLWPASGPLVFGFWRLARCTRGACGQPLGLYCVIFGIFSACGRCSWPARGSLMFGLGSLGGFMARLWASSVLFLASSRHVGGAHGQPLALECLVLGSLCGFVASLWASSVLFSASSRLAPAIRGQTLGSKVLGFRCLPGLPPPFMARLLGLRFLVLCVFPASPRHSWTDLWV